MKDRKDSIVLIVNTLFIISLLLIGIFLYYFYTKLSVPKCKEGESLYNKECIKKVISCEIKNGLGHQTWASGSYDLCKAISCDTGFEIISNSCLPEIRERSILLTGSIIAKDYTLGSYPSFKINNKIEGGVIKMTVDFQESYKNGRYDNFIYGGKSDGGKANPAPFGLFFFIGKNNDNGKSPYNFGYGGFFNALANKNGGDLRNSNSLGINGVIPGNQIIGGYTWEVPLKNGVIFATKKDERAEDYKYKKLNVLDYINNKVGSSIFIGGFLSNMGGSDGWEITQIKSIEINYLGTNDALSIE